jgi:hypothetical protein
MRFLLTRRRRLDGRPADRFSPIKAQRDAETVHVVEKFFAETEPGIKWLNSHRIVVGPRGASINGFTDPAGEKAKKDQPWLFVQTARGRILNCCWRGGAANARVDELVR